MAWTYLFGAVSFELFGQRHNVITDEGRRRDVCGKETLVIMTIIIRCWKRSSAGTHTGRS